MRNFRVVKFLQKGVVSFFLLVGGLLTILGSGGGPDSPSTSDNYDQASIFYNGMSCKGKKTIAHFYFQGKKISLETGKFSHCMDIRVNLNEARIKIRTVIESTVCNNIEGTNELSMVSGDGCTSIIYPQIQAYIGLQATVDRKCPGYCANKLPAGSKMSDLIEQNMDSTHIEDISVE